MNDEPYPVNIIRSKKRKKTIGARLEGGVIEVRAPERMSERELNETIENFQERFQKERLRETLNRDQNLWPITKRLNQKYFNGEIKFRLIEYATNLTSMYGYCDTATGEIKISSELAKMPKWVRDYVIVHELAHLIEANHGKRFWALVNRFPLTERARGFLLAKGLEEGASEDDEKRPPEPAPEEEDYYEDLEQTYFKWGTRT